MKKHPLIMLLLLLLFLSTFHIYVVHVVVSSSIPLGSSLFASNPNASWSSPNSTFSVSFIPVTPPTTPPTFLSAITYAGGVPIWTAGPPVDSAASLHLFSSGSLRLLNGSGAIVWDSATDNLGVTSAIIEDSGNLLLVHNRSHLVWSSFESPVNTIVQSQNLTTGKALRSGFYSFELHKDGKITLKWNNTIMYWNQGLNSSVNANLSSPSLELKQTGGLSLSDRNLASEVVIAFSNDLGEEGNDILDILRFLRLDVDGNLRMYSSVRDSGIITLRWAALSDQCQVFGYCGNLGICSHKDFNPVCECPSLNFEPLDANDRTKGCKRKVELSTCEATVTMVNLDHTVFLTYPPELSPDRFTLGISACRVNCLRNAESCVASSSLSDGTGVCYLKTPGFISGYQSPALPSISFVKVCDPALPSVGILGEDKDGLVNVWIIFVLAVMVTLLGLFALTCCSWFWCCRDSSKLGVLSTQYAVLEYASGAPIQFSYKELKRCTKGFRNKLGEGGFGTVYRGVLANRSVVAVKQLEGIEQGEKQFRMEVATISSTHHLNLVRLIGFCSEGRHRLLVYEFMKNGSLDSFLFHQPLSWENRFNIALGTARGITYLHEECRECIVHCDIKPENILLDEYYNSKVSDFGLAKLVNTKEQRYDTLTSVRGTRGYLAPEWISNLPITSKSDVYSYGMVLLEIVSGKRNFEVSGETKQKKFSLWAYEELEEGNWKDIIDKRVRLNQEMEMEQAMRMIMVSFWCMQEQPSQRPMMGKVVQMLEGVIEIQKPPPLKAASTESQTSINVQAFAVSGTGTSPLIGLAGL